MTSVWSHCNQLCLSEDRGVVHSGTCFRLPNNWHCIVDHPRKLLLDEQAMSERARRIFFTITQQ
jgi:hypothetical protein